MARPLRITYPSAWYHVMNRGAGRRAVFKTQAQRHYFLSLLAATQERFNAEWHAYCLMGNHYHLLVRTPEGNLERIMRHVNGLYTQYFNRSEKTDGPLFRGRYRAVLVDAKAHWLALSRYIHRNPLDAHRCRRLADYRSSSYRAYIALEKRPAWLTTHYVLAAITQRDRPARYRAYVAEGSDEALCAFYARAKIDPVLGDVAFRAKVLTGHRPHVDLPELNAVCVRPTLEQIVSVTCKTYRLPPRRSGSPHAGGGSPPPRAAWRCICVNSWQTCAWQKSLRPLAWRVMPVPGHRFAKSGSDSPAIGH